MKCKKLKLKNGLTVLLIPSHKSPVVSIQAWVRTGSADENAEQKGISHFIEHLVFKGTKSFAVGDIAKAIEGSGGELNAYTSFDQTVFYVTISKDFTDIGVKAVAEMMTSPRFDADEIDREREVVIEEIKRGMDSPGRRASQLFFSTAFQKHPYGIPVIGYDKIVREVPRKTLVKYFEARYTPKNSFVVAVGDFKEKQMLKEIETHFGAYPKRTFKAVKRAVEPKYKAPRLGVESSPFDDYYLYLGFRIPNATHKDVPALDLAASVLGQGDSSRLVHNLRIVNPIATSIGASTFTPSDEGLFCISAVFKEEKLTELLNGIEIELLRMIEAPVTIQELAKVKTSFESDLYYSLETVDSLARRFGNLEFVFNDPNYFEKYLDQIRKIKVQDIHKTIKSWIKPESMVIAGLGKNQELLEKTLKEWQAQLVLSIENALNPKAVHPIEIKKISLSTTKSPKTEKIVLDSGITLLLREIKETPVISVKAAFLGGIRAEDSKHPSTCELLSRTWISGTDDGTKKMSEEEIYHYLEERAAQISAYTGRNSVGLSMDCLAPLQKDCGELWSNILTHSLWGEATLEREKVILNNQIQSRNDNPAQLAIMNLQKRIFGSHPYAKDLWGTQESVTATTRQSLVDYFSSINKTHNLTIGIAGQFDKPLWLQIAKNLGKNIGSGQRFNQRFSFDAKKHTKEDRHHQNLKREQTHIVLGYPGLTIDSPERYALQLMMAVLSGQGGRLFLELRDKNSLAYSVSPLHMEGIDAGYVGAYIGCSPEKTEKAIEMLKHEFARLISTEIDDAELSAAKRNLIGSHHIDLQRTSTVNSSILFDDIYGIHFDETFHFGERIAAVTAIEVQLLAKKLYGSAPLISIIGPK